MAKQSNNKNSGSRLYPAGLSIGMGIGLLLGAAMDNMAIGVCLGSGIGLCFSVALGRHDDSRGDDGHE